MVCISHFYSPPRAWATVPEEFLQQKRVLSFLNKEDVIFGTLLNDDLTKSQESENTMKHMDLATI